MADQRQCFLAEIFHGLRMSKPTRSQWWGMWGISHLLWTIGRLHTLRLGLQFVHLQGLGEFQWASPRSARVLGRWAPSIGWLRKFRLGFDGWTADRVETRATGVAPNDEMNVSVATMHSRFHPFHTSTVQGKNTWCRQFAEVESSRFCGWRWDYFHVFLCAFLPH